MLLSWVRRCWFKSIGGSIFFGSVDIVGRCGSNCGDNVFCSSDGIFFGVVGCGGSVVGIGNGSDKQCAMFGIVVGSDSENVGIGDNIVCRRRSSFLSEFLGRRDDFF